MRQCRTWLALVVLAGMMVLPTSASASSPPQITWTPQTSGSYGYGAVTPGQTASQTFTLTNSGGTATRSLSVALSGSTAFTKTSDACTGTSLGPKKSCSVTVQYAPTTAGESDTATLTASGKKPPASASITLTGSGAGTPGLSLSPGLFFGTTQFGTKLYNYNFGLGSDATQTFTVTNGGPGSSNTLLVSVIDGSFEFSLTNDTCSDNSLAPNGTCTFDLTFTAPVGCIPNVETFPMQLHVDFQDNGTPYIQLDGEERCPG